MSKHTGPFTFAGTPLRDAGLDKPRPSRMRRTEATPQPAPILWFLFRVHSASPPLPSQRLPPP